MAILPRPPARCLRGDRRGLRIKAFSTRVIVLRETVYIETTIVSYLTAWLSRDLIRAAHQQLTQEWWETRRFDFELVVSEAVLNEAGAGDSSAAIERLEVLRGIRLLEINDAAALLAERLVAEKVLPEKAAVDALHISISAINNIDYLLTWNCKHIANAEMKSAIMAVCERDGFRCPHICTPEELLGGSYGMEG